MKKILLFIISCATLIACNTDNDQNIVPGTTGNAVSISEATIPPTGNEGEQISFTITSDVSWKIQNKPSWLNISPSSGNAGTTRVKMYAGINSDPEPSREGSVVITSSDKSFTESISVFQERPYLEISRESVNFNWDHCETYDSTREEILIRCNTDWQIDLANGGLYTFSSMLSRAQEDNQSWVFNDWLVCSQIQGPAVTEGHTLYFNPNTYNIDREPKAAKLVIRGALDEYVLDFSQNNLLFIVDLVGSADNEHCNFAACYTEDVHMTVESERSWHIYSKPDWLIVDPAEGNSLTTNVKFNIDGANPAAEERAGTLVLVADVNTIPLPQRAIEITQNGYEFVVVPGDRSISNSGASFSGYISSSGSWEIDSTTIPDWLEVSTLSGSGSAREDIQFSVNEQNLELSTRVANLKFRSTQYGNTMSQDVKVEQEQFVFDAEISEPYIGTIQTSSHDLTINSSGNWAIDVLYDDSSSEKWLNVEQLQGEGYAVVKYNAKTANNVDEDRSATISIRSMTHEAAGIHDVVKELRIVQRKYTFEVEPTPDNFSLSYDAVDIKIITIHIDCSTDWSIECPSWLMPNPRSGSNYADVSFLISDFNLTSTPRNGQVVIKSEYLNRERRFTFNVSQGAFRFNSTALQFNNLDALDAQTCEVNIECSGHWELTDVADWIKPSITSGFGDYKISVRVDDNVKTEPRLTTFYVQSTLKPELTKRVSIEQKAFVFDTTPTSVPEFAAVDVVAKEVNLGECMSTWTVRDIPSWLSVTPSSGTGSATLRIIPQENTAETNKSRQATIRVVSDRNADVYKEITITQGEFLFDMTETTLPEFNAYNPGSADVIISESTSTWSVVEAPDWVTIQPMFGSGVGRITITPATNQTSLSRSATFYVQSDKNPSLRKRINISQGRYTLVASPPSISATATSTATYTINVNCSGRWQASCSADWVNLGARASGTGNGAITFTVNNNTSVSSRSATIVISSLDGYNSTVNITVTQTGR